MSWNVTPKLILVQDFVTNSADVVMNSSIMCYSSVICRCCSHRGVAASGLKHEGLQRTFLPIRTAIDSHAAITALLCLQLDEFTTIMSECLA